MPTKVTGEDGRVLHENLSDHDAADLARTVHTNTGEVVTLTPYRFNGDEYVLDHEGARTIGAAPAPEPVVEETKEPEKVEKPKRAPRKKAETPAAPKEKSAPRATSATKKKTSSTKKK